VTSFVRRLFVTQPHDRIRTGEGPALRRVLGIAGLTAIGLGTMLGGIFATIGSGMLAAGPGVILSFILSGLACFFVSLCYAELASMVPIAGSAYTYAYATLGEVVAWIIGWDLILEYGISVAPLAASWSGAVQSLLADNFGIKFPVWAQVASLVATHGSLDLGHTQIDVAAMFVVLVLTALLAVGIRESAGTNGVLVVVQLVGLVVFIVALIAAVHPGNFHPTFPTGVHGVVSGAALVFFAYIGFDTVTVASEEAKRPARDVPIAVVTSLFIGALLFIGIAWVTVGIVPWQHVSKDAGMFDAVRLAGNNRIVYTITFIGTFAGTTTVMLTSLLGQIRIFHVMARDRMLPPWISRVNPRTRTPIAPTLITGVLVAILAGVVPLEVLLSLVNIGTLSAFAIVCAGVFVLRSTKPHAERPFRAPFGRLVAVLGVVMCLFLMVYGLNDLTWKRFIIWFVVGMLVYALYGYRHSLLRPGASVSGEPLKESP